MASADTLPRILLVSLGGTIAMTPTQDGDGVSPTLHGDDLVAAAGDLSAVATIHTHSVGPIPGAHLAFDDILELVDRIEVDLDEHDGVVVTQGTDTIEETAYLLDLLITGETPVVVTGAMRHPATPGADGPANLRAAIQVAANSRARGLGVLVVLGDEIHAARFVRKSNSTSPAAFRSLPGPIGWIAEGAPHVVFHPARRSGVPRPPRGSAVPVALITVAFGDDGRLLTALPELGYRGVVVEALGGGHVPDAMADAIEGVAETMPVVFASRTGTGSALRQTYDFPGSEMDLRRRGAVPSDLDGPKARVLLTVLLSSGLDGEAVADSFADLAGSDRAAPDSVE